MLDLRHGVIDCEIARMCGEKNRAGGDARATTKRRKLSRYIQLFTCMYYRIANGSYEILYVYNQQKGTKKGVVSILYS